MEVWSPDQLKQHLDNGERVFLKLWKKGCGACKLSIPAVERLETANVHNLKFGQINSDDFPEILDIAQTDVLPVFFVFIDRKRRGKHIGFKGLQKLQEFVDGAANAE